MFSDINRPGARPKSITAIEQSIFNDAPPPIEILRYRYRKMFGLTEQELEQEPIDTFYTNLFIHAQIAEKQRLEAKNG